MYCVCFCIKVQVFIWCYSSRTVCKPTGGDDVTSSPSSTVARPMSDVSAVLFVIAGATSQPAFTSRLHMDEQVGFAGPVPAAPETPRTSPPHSPSERPAASAGLLCNVPAVSGTC